MLSDQSSGDLHLLFRFQGERAGGSHSAAHAGPADSRATANAHVSANSAADASTDAAAYPGTSAELLQVVKQLRRRLCNWMVQLEPIQLRRLRWDLVRPNAARRREAPRGMSAKFRALRQD